MAIASSFPPSTPRSATAAANYAVGDASILCLDFGNSSSLAEIRKLTDVGAMTRLLHQCIAHQRDLDLQLDTLLSRRADLDRSLSSLLRSAPPLISLAASDASSLLSSAESTAHLADLLSARVRHLDLVHSRAESAHSRVLASLDRSRFLDLARHSLSSGDLHSAAKAIQNFLNIDHRFPSSDGLRGELLAVKNDLESLARSHLASAIDNRNHPTIISSIKLFPLLGLADEGLQAFVSYLKKVVNLRSRLDFEHLSDLTSSLGPSTERPDFLGCLTRLFKDIVVAIEENDMVLRELCGEDGVVFAIIELQEECDSRGTQVLRKYTEHRKLGRLADEINSYSKKLMSISAVGTVIEGPDPREVETYLEEILGLALLGEDYMEYMASKIRELPDIKPELAPRAKRAFRGGSFSKMVQELTGYYVVLEEFFMSENLRKAIRIDEPVTDGLTTSMVDDVFFVLQSCCRRAVSTLSINSTLAVLSSAANLLANEYREALQEKLREPNLGAKLFLVTTTQKSSIEIATALNNVDVSSEYVLKLKHEIEELCTEAFPGPADREKVKSCLSELGEISSILKKILNSGLEQLISSVAQRVRPVLDAVATVSYELTDVEYGENEMNDPWVQKLLHTVEVNTAWLQSVMTSNNYDTFVHFIIDFIVKRLEVIMMQKRFSQLGGLQLDKEVRALINYFSETSQRPVRDKFSRLSQMTTILNFERVSEILDFWGDNAGHMTWLLTPTEVKRVLGLRVDFRPEAISALRL